MNNTPILETIDPEIMGRLASRREAIKQGASMSTALATALAIGSVPIALAGLTKDVFGQAPLTIKQVLDFAFLLENLEAEFYKAVLGESAVAAYNTAFIPVRALIPAKARASITLIRTHEVAHVAFLRAALDTMGGPARVWAASDFDFTGGNGSGTGPFARATTDLQFLLVATQAFEDTGVRAYKGQAGNLISNDTLLEAALRIHSVEARHAAQIRKIRRENGAPDTVRYSGTVRGGGAGAAGAGNVTAPPAEVVTALGLIYAGEDTNNVSTLNFGTTLPGVSAGDLAFAIGEAFDEPLTREQVVAIVEPFVIPAIT
ncbi:MAG: ferritin-like domain-containing protein [Anaerolineae bacterium]|nr:ferritin-like domain-containing protein [Gemmatimonadaceae bacterium]